MDKATSAVAGQGRLHWHRVANALPGLALAAAVAVVARIAAAPTQIPAVMIALGAGLLLSFWGEHKVLKAGLDLGSRQVLRIGIVLLGAQITFQQVVELGIGPFAVAVGALALTMIFGWAIARWLRLSVELAWLTAAAVSICGASAALAVAAVLPRSPKLEESVAATIGGITVIGTGAMLLYPHLGAATGLGPEGIGVFLGASLHEVVQAVGAGFAVSDQAGEVATTVKLVRVACLGPVILLVGWWARARAGEDAGPRPAMVPAFLIGFVLLAALASLGALPKPVVSVLADVSRLCLLVAIAALGMKVSPRRLVSFGAVPALAITLQTLAIAALALGGALLLQRG